MSTEKWFFALLGGCPNYPMGFGGAGHVSGGIGFIFCTACSISPIVVRSDTEFSGKPMQFPFPFSPLPCYLNISCLNLIGRVSTCAGALTVMRTVAGVNSKASFASVPTGWSGGSGGVVVESGGLVLAI